MNKSSKIYIAGHRGLVGSAIHRKLIAEGYNNIITRTSNELDLRNQIEVNNFFIQENPEYVFLIAARAGGVHALNTYRANAIYDNIYIQTNVIHNAYLRGVKKLMFMGSNCLYPKSALQPLKEEYILSGKLEHTTKSYAIAKLSGVEMCNAYRTQYGCNFITAIPVNMYGDNDNYDTEKAHVMAAILKRISTAKINDYPSVEIWGSGKQRREFMHSDDLAEACLFLMLNYNDSDPINIGTGNDISIMELAEMIKDISGYKGDLIFNADKPEGISGKLLDTSRINQLGWHHKIELREGIEKVYKSL